MEITIVFLLGFVFAFLGVIPPGLLNMTAAKISLKEGHVRGIMFSIGASIVVLAQTYLATIFASYLSKNPEVVDVLRRVAVVIFALITIYFLFIAKSKEPKEFKLKKRSKHSRFFQGILMSALNVFPIPYQAYITITLASLGWLNFDNTSIISYVAGAVMGSFAIFYLYIFFFDKIKSRTLTSQKNMNRLIGGITAVMCVVTIIGIIKG
ncbi:LysE family transporter [Tamlana sp. 2_MG-2023]|uniref:LysE family translocator n=1 Tax=unclassified Tamlana TaxID=2614803 RepID=UPI0026E39503|nr:MULTISPECIES: LysE family transporter [unclassified Tamlana]MDO6760640.1 LysE family transporter [Tamlana sp. 2_MG-2023]MDO6790896.1 LysE family transporter [Tamlana sp. 1_MG-2023]